MAAECRTPHAKIISDPVHEHHQLSTNQRVSRNLALDPGRIGQDLFTARWRARETPENIMAGASLRPDADLAFGFRLSIFARFLSSQKFSIVWIGGSIIGTYMEASF